MKDDSNSAYNQAKQALQAGQWDEAWLLLQQAADHPEAETVMARLEQLKTGDQQIKNIIQSGDAQIQGGEFQRAEDAYRRAIMRAEEIGILKYHADLEKKRNQAGEQTNRQQQVVESQESAQLLEIIGPGEDELDKGRRANLQGDFKMSKKHFETARRFFQENLETYPGHKKLAFLWEEATDLIQVCTIQIFAQTDWQNDKPDKALKALNNALILLERAQMNGHHYATVAAVVNALLKTPPDEVLIPVFAPPADPPSFVITTEPDILTDTVPQNSSLPEKQDSVSTWEHEAQKAIAASNYRKAVIALEYALQNSEDTQQQIRLKSWMIDLQPQADRQRQQQQAIEEGEQLLARQQYLPAYEVFNRATLLGADIPDLLNVAQAGSRLIQIRRQCQAELSDIFELIKENPYAQNIVQAIKNLQQYLDT